MSDAWLPLSQGMQTVVDEADYDLLSRYKWSAARRHRRGIVVFYAVRCIIHGPGSQEIVLLHRSLLGVTDRKIDVDHIDGDCLNNRRDNLREATRSQNNANARPRPGGTSQYKGVCRHTDGAWVAQINAYNKHRYLGSFSDEVSAARAYNKAAFEAFGEFAYLNVIPEV